MDVDRPPLDMDLVRAHGLALALIASLIRRPVPVEPVEFAKLLGILATVTAEVSSRQGDILAFWAGMICDSSEAPRPTGH